MVKNEMIDDENGFHDFQLVTCWKCLIELGTSGKSLSSVRRSGTELLFKNDIGNHDGVFDK